MKEQPTNPPESIGPDAGGDAAGGGKGKGSDDALAAAPSSAPAPQPSGTANPPEIIEPDADDEAADQVDGLSGGSDDKGKGKQEATGAPERQPGPGRTTPSPNTLPVPSDQQLRVPSNRHDGDIEAQIKLFKTGRSYYFFCRGRIGDEFDNLVFTRKPEHGIDVLRVWVDESHLVPEEVAQVEGFENYEILYEGEGDGEESRVRLYVRRNVAQVLARTRILTPPASVPASRTGSQTEPPATDLTSSTNDTPAAPQPETESRGVNYDVVNGTPSNYYFIRDLQRESYVGAVTKDRELNRIYVDVPHLIPEDVARADGIEKYEVLHEDGLGEENAEQRMFVHRKIAVEIQRQYEALKAELVRRFIW